MKGLEADALDRVVHQLVPLIVYDLMRSHVRGGPTSLAIVVGDGPPLPSGAKVLLVLEGPVEARGDRRHVERADR